VLSWLNNILHDQHSKEILKAGSGSFLYRILGIILSYGFTVLVTRSMGASTWGIFALCLALLHITSMFGRLGFDTASIRFVAEYTATNKLNLLKGTYSKMIISAFLASLLLTILLIFFSADIASTIFNKPHLSPYIKLISIGIIPMTLLHITSESFRGKKKTNAYAFFRFTSPFLYSCLLIIPVIFFYKDQDLPIYIFTTSLVLGCIHAMYRWNKENGILIRWSKEVSFKKIINVSFPMLLTGSLTLIVMGWADIFILGIYTSEDQIGIYNIALKVANLAGLALFAINAISAPKFAEAYGKNDIGTLKILIQKSTKLIFLCSFPVIIMLVLVPKFWLGLFGEAFESGIYVLLFLAFSQFINSICGSVAYILQMTGKEKILQNIMIITTIINISLNFILIPDYGINGAAIASLVSMVFWNLASVFYIKKYLNIYTFSFSELFGNKKAN